MSEAKVADTKPVVLELEPAKYYWCSCGESQNQPYCDGSHKGSGFVPFLLELTEKKTVALCNCKQTANQPYCDGAHAKL